MIKGSGFVQIFTDPDLRGLKPKTLVFMFLKFFDEVVYLSEFRIICNVGIVPVGYLVPVAIPCCNIPPLEP